MTKLFYKIGKNLEGIPGHNNLSLLSSQYQSSQCSFIFKESPLNFLDLNHINRGISTAPASSLSFRNFRGMAVSFRYWDDCADPEDLESMWKDPEVSSEWINAGETKESKVHLSRDPDGQPYLTQTEMKDMLCAIAELESDRQPLSTRYNKKKKETTIGIMQILPKTAEWLVRELGFNTYQVEGDSKILYKPFVNVYLGAAYLKYLSTYEQKERSEEFMVRAYKGGTNKATHKSTLLFWRRYLSVKESLPSRKVFEVGPTPSGPSPPAAPVSQSKGDGNITWDSRTSPEDMGEMWSNTNVNKEWLKCREKHGKVQVSHDIDNRPYLSRVELKGVAEIILSKHFSTTGLQPSVLCAISEIISMRYLNGAGQRTGLMGIDYSTALWLNKDLGYKAYIVESVENLTKPFVSVYFGAAYMAWLANYEGSERSTKFIVQAYLGGPQNVNLQETGPLWLKFEEALSHYEDLKKDQGSCNIL